MLIRLIFVILLVTVFGNLLFEFINKNTGELLNFKGVKKFIMSYLMGIGYLIFISYIFLIINIKINIITISLMIFLPSLILIIYTIKNNENSEFKMSLKGRIKNFADKLYKIKNSNKFVMILYSPTIFLIINFIILSNVPRGVDEQSHLIFASQILNGEYNFGSILFPNGQTELATSVGYSLLIAIFGILTANSNMAYIAVKIGIIHLTLIMICLIKLIETKIQDNSLPQYITVLSIPIIPMIYSRGLGGGLWEISALLFFSGSLLIYFNDSSNWLEWIIIAFIVGICFMLMSFYGIIALFFYFIGTIISWKEELITKDRTDWNLLVQLSLKRLTIPIMIIFLNYRWILVRLKDESLPARHAVLTSFHNMEGSFRVLLTDNFYFIPLLGLIFAILYLKSSDVKYQEIGITTLAIFIYYLYGYKISSDIMILGWLQPVRFQLALEFLFLLNIGLFNSSKIPLLFNLNLISVFKGSNHELLNEINIQRLRSLIINIRNMFLISLIIFSLFISSYKSYYYNYQEVGNGHYISEDDYVIAEWIKHNTENNEIIIAPNDFSGDWVPIITSRSSNQYRLSPFQVNENQINIPKVFNEFLENPSKEETILSLINMNAKYFFLPKYSGYNKHYNSSNLKLLMDINGARLYKLVIDPVNLDSNHIEVEKYSTLNVFDYYSVDVRFRDLQNSAILKNSINIPLNLSMIQNSNYNKIQFTIKSTNGGNFGLRYHFKYNNIDLGMQIKPSSKLKFETYKFEFDLDLQNKTNYLEIYWDGLYLSELETPLEISGQIFNFIPRIDWLEYRFLT